MNVLLLHPYIPARFNGAPMGLLYLAAHLQQAGHYVEIVDLQASGSARFTKTTTSRVSFDIIGISSTSPSHKAAVELAVQARAIWPDAFIVKGGVHETYCAQHTLSNVPEINYSMIGECDTSFVELLTALSDPSDLSNVAGLVWRNGSNIIVNRASPTRVDLSRPPNLPRELLKEKSKYNFRIFEGMQTAQVQTMRGCPYKCSFCNQRNQIVNFVSEDAVLSELKYISDAGYEAAFFDDATFTVNKKRTALLMRLIREQGISLRFAAQTRADCVDEIIVSDMARSGFVYLSFGLETADENAMKTLLKSRSPSVHLNKTEIAVKSCRAHGIKSCINIIVGLPNETHASLMNTFNYVNKLNPDFVSISALALYPHEDLSTADQYLAGVSEEDIWENFDEGYGAVHPYITAQQATHIFELASRSLGPRLELV